MKRIEATLLTLDNKTRKDLEEVLKKGEFVGELETYEEIKIPAKGDILTNYSFEMLKKAVFDFINSIWIAVTSFGKMLGWSTIMIVESIKYLWKNGIGKEKE